MYKWKVREVGFLGVDRGNKNKAGKNKGSIILANFQ